jgi:hypothetical protein
MSMGPCDFMDEVLRLMAEYDIQYPDPEDEGDWGTEDYNNATDALREALEERADLLLALRELERLTHRDAQNAPGFDGATSAAWETTRKLLAGIDGTEEPL